jgi:hypothetical protein
VGYFCFNFQLHALTHVPELIDALIKTFQTTNRLDNTHFIDAVRSLVFDPFSDIPPSLKGICLVYEARECTFRSDQVRACFVRRGPFSLLQHLLPVNILYSIIASTCSSRTLSHAVPTIFEFFS